MPSREQAADLQRKLGAAAIARRVNDYLESVREIERRDPDGRASSTRCRCSMLPAAPAGIPYLVRRARQADVRPAGAGLPGEHHARRHVHGGARDQQPDVSAGRRARWPSRHLASPEPAPRRSRRTSRSRRTTSACSRDSWRSCDATPDGDGIAARPLDHPLRQQHEQQQRAQSLPAAEPRGRRRERARSRAAATSSIPDHTPMTNLLLTCSTRPACRWTRSATARARSRLEIADFSLQIADRLSIAEVLSQSSRVSYGAIGLGSHRQSAANPQSAICIRSAICNLHLAISRF